MFRVRRVVRGGAEGYSTNRVANGGVVGGIVGGIVGYAAGKYADGLLNNYLWK